ncbi:hypothetical protein MD537_25210, partial [Flavihumibacter sediminis]|nr:hypothetical protein [Flavihumibacter sediminis]
GFIPGTINIQGNNSFSTWAGWYLNYEEPFILVAEEAQLDDLTRKLMRIGLDNILGYISVEDIEKVADGKLDTVKLVEYDEFKKIVDAGTAEIIDLRG